MNRRTRLFLSSLVLPTLLVGVPVWLTWRAVRQDKLDRALITAVWESKTDTVVSLLKQGVDPNARQRIRETVSFRQAFLNLFLRFHGEIKPQREQGDTALSLAVSDLIPPRARAALIRHVEPLIVKALLDAGADPNCRDSFHYTPLLLAVNTCPSQVQHLLDKGADVNARDAYGRTPLMFADDAAIMRLLLDRRADVNAHDCDGTPVLLYSLYYGDASPQIVRLLLDRGAKVNEGDKKGFTPLMQAVMHENAPCVRLLLDRGADVNARNGLGDNALFFADRPEIARLLLAQHCDPNARNNQGRTALAVLEADYKDDLSLPYEDTINLLKQAGAKK